MGIFTRIHRHFYNRDRNVLNSIAPKGADEDLLITMPEMQQADEITQSIGKLELVEQLQIIQIVKSYIEEFTVHPVKIEPFWISGHAMLNEMFITQGNQTLMRCNVEAFYQNKHTGLRELIYLVSMVKFEGDRWCVFQVKEVIIA